MASIISKLPPLTPPAGVRDGDALMRTLSPRRTAKWDDAGTSVLPPLQTPIQRQLVATLTKNAALASNRATPHLLSALGDPKLSVLLRQRGLPELAALPPAEPVPT